MPFQVDDHPFLELYAFISLFPRPLSECGLGDALNAAIANPGSSPFTRDEASREAVRTLLRHGGFKPTGRNKPASEYLGKALEEGRFPSINLAVDAANVASLASQLPISVVDVELAHEPWHVRLAGPETSYVFNASGQTIEVEGLLCLFDADGACANAVKDAQRTKTRPTTKRTLSLLWGTRELPGRAERLDQWYRQLLAGAGVETERVWPRT